MRTWQALLIIIGSLAVSVARANKIEITRDYGGLLSWYQLQWEKLPAPACPLALAAWLYSARKDLRNSKCISRIPFGHHGLCYATLLKAYPPDIRLWIDQHGGLTWQMLWLQAPALYRQSPRRPNPPPRSV